LVEEVRLEELAGAGPGAGAWTRRVVESASKKEVKRWKFGAEVGRGWVVQQNWKTGGIMQGLLSTRWSMQYQSGCSYSEC
jgi:hypothetical protein